MLLLVLVLLLLLVTLTIVIVSVIYFYDLLYYYCNYFVRQLGSQLGQERWTAGAVLAAGHNSTFLALPPTCKISMISIMQYIYIYMIYIYIERERGREREGERDTDM